MLSLVDNFLSRLADVKMIIQSLKIRHTLPVDVGGFLMPAEIEERTEITEK